MPDSQKADSAFGGGMNERDQLRESARYITRLEAERDRYKQERDEVLTGQAYSRLEADLNRYKADAQRAAMVRAFLDDRERYKDWDADGLAVALVQLLYDSRPLTEREREVGKRLIREARARNGRGATE